MFELPFWRELRMHQRRVATRFWQSVVAVSRWTRNRVGMPGQSVVHMPGQQTDVFHPAVVPGHSAPSFGVASGPVRIVVLVEKVAGRNRFDLWFRRWFVHSLAFVTFIGHVSSELRSVLRSDGTPATPGGVGVAAF